VNYVCHVVKFHLARFKLIQISVKLSDMSNTCLLLSFHSNATSLCCYENYEDDIDYFVVKACFTFRNFYFGM
jgi:hypothetical protein